MSGLPPSEFNYPSAGQQSSIPTSDSRLLDAAETLVTLQSRGGGRGRHSAISEESSPGKSRSVYLTPHQQDSYKMAPQPPTSSGQTSMGPPPPPPPQAAASNNVTFVLINQPPSQTNLMRPPVEPPPRRGRGRGRGRGGSTSPSESTGRGRGRGRGRGTARVQPPPIERIDQQDVDMGPSQDDVDMIEPTNDIQVPVKEETFMVGDMELKDSIFNDILNKKKLELMMDPEIIALFSKHQKTLQQNSVKK